MRYPVKAVMRIVFALMASGSLIENDNGTTGAAALGYSVTFGGGETRSTKAGIGFQRPTLMAGAI
jgi:hypothetical protein